MTDLGEVYRDRLSGFVGVADAWTDYLNSTSRTRLVAYTGPTGDEKTRWFDDASLDPCDEQQRMGFGS